MASNDMLTAVRDISTSVAVSPLVTKDPPSRTSAESAKAKSSTRTMQLMAQNFKGANAKQELVRAVDNGVRNGEMTAAHDQALGAIWKEIKSLTEGVRSVAKANAGLSEGLHKFEVRTSMLINQALETGTRTLSGYIADVVKEDALLSKANAEHLSQRMRGACCTELVTAMREWYTLRNDVIERIKAAGLPIISGGVFTYLNNSTGITNSPDARLALVLGIGAAALYGRGTPTWLSNGITPAIEYFGNFFGVRQGLSKAALTSKVDTITAALKAAPPWKVKVTADMRPALFTKANTKVAFKGGFGLMRSTRAGVAPLGVYLLPTDADDSFDIYSKPVVDMAIYPVGAVDRLASSYVGEVSLLMQVGTEDNAGTETHQVSLTFDLPADGPTLP